MTLQPGDLILTGTPDGVVDCQPGDVVVTEIEGIGALVNTIFALETPSAVPQRGAPQLRSEPNFVECPASPVVRFS